LHRRVDTECQDHLTQIIFGKTSSAYFQRAKDDYGEKGKNFRNAVDEFGSFDIEQPG
jgi:hypothetical protein